MLSLKTGFSLRLIQATGAFGNIPPGLVFHKTSLWDGEQISETQRLREMVREVPRVNQTIQSKVLGFMRKLAGRGCT